MNTTAKSGQWVRLAGEDTDASIDGFELFSARRALSLLKGKLGRIRLLELLSDEIAAGDAFLRGHLERSSGEEATGTTTLHAHGITAAEFTGWLARAFAREDVMLAGHPEHYSIHAEPGRDVNIVETLGEVVAVLTLIVVGVIVIGLVGEIVRGLIHVLELALVAAVAAVVGYGAGRVHGRKPKP